MLTKQLYFCAFSSAVLVQTLTDLESTQLSLALRLAQSFLPRWKGVHRRQAANG